MSIDKRLIEIEFRIRSILGNSTAIRGFYVLADQVTVSISHFIIAFAIARNESEEIFGAFIIIYSIATILLNVSNSLIYIPASVYGSARPEIAERKYDLAVILSVLTFSLIVIFVLSVIGIASYIWKSESILSKASFGFAVPFGLYSLGNGFRKILIIKGKPNIAFFADTLSLIIIVILVYYLHTQNKITLQNIYMSFALSSIVMAVVSASRLSSQLGTRTNEQVKNALIKNWRYGKWTLANQIVAAAGGRIPLFALSIITGLKSTGAMGAYVQIMGPLTMFYQALDNFSLPETTRRNFLKGYQEYMFFLKKIYVRSAVIPFLYLSVPVIFGRDLLKVLYKGKYIDSYGSIYFLLAYYAIVYIVRPYTQYFLAIKKPNVLFWASLTKVIVITIFAVPLIKLLGIYGATLLVLLGGIFMFSFIYYHYKTHNLD